MAQAGSQKRRARLVAVMCGMVAAVGLSVTASASAGFHVVHSFCKKAGCPDGGPALAGVIADDSGNFYGAALGGPGNGVVFELANSGGKLSYSRLRNFCTGTCKDGAGLEFPLIRDVAGNLYGTTAQGGSTGGGIAFELIPGANRWRLQVLHTFCTSGSDTCKEGASPSAGLAYQGAAAGLPYDGQSPLYGTTAEGGTLNGGTVFVLSLKDGKRHAKALYSFCSQIGCAEGSVPLGGLILDSAGNIFGVANLGGTQGEGAVFELSPTGTKYTYGVIYSFCSLQTCTDGIRPGAGLALDPLGNLYGTTTRSGTHDEGTLFELFPSVGKFGFSVLYQFCGDANCADGADPEAALTLDDSGNLYGTTAQGGSAQAGAVFELSPAQSGWSQDVLYSFCSEAGCKDGLVPKSRVFLDASGNIFGTTVAGGSSNSGVAFELRL
jgi:uncharacterized repeat protein (TIGR03803 family)